MTGEKTGFAAMLAQARLADGSISLSMPESWRQGRTAYGGFTAAVAYQAARAAASDLPVLRSAQIAFIGPVGADLRASGSLLRRGKSSAFIEVRVISDGALAMLSTFLFMADRPSRVRLPAPLAPAAPSPDAAEPAMRGKGPAYRDQFEFRHAASTQARHKPELLRWVRLRERDDIDPVSEIFLIGDALPAGVLPLFDVPPIISSANWTVHLHDATGSGDDGWWLVHCAALSAEDGVSVQSMAAWNRRGATGFTGSQTVSYF